MTAPTPEQMRVLAERPDVDHWSAAAREALKAAANEVDRLRAENEHLAGELSAVAANRDHTADEFRRLRSVIENAPHAIGCSWFNTAAGLSCNCWKGDAP